MTPGGEHTPVPRTTSRPASLRAAQGDMGREPRGTRRADALTVLVLALVAIVLAIINREALLGALASRYTAVAVLSVVITLLVVKSGDRTRIYRLEAQQLRRQRRELMRLLAETRAVLRSGVEAPRTEEEGRPGDWHRRAKDLIDDIDRHL